MNKNIKTDTKQGDIKYISLVMPERLALLKSMVKKRTLIGFKMNYISKENCLRAATSCKKGFENFSIWKTGSRLIRYRDLGDGDNAMQYPKFNPYVENEVLNYYKVVI